MTTPWLRVFCPTKGCGPSSQARKVRVSHGGAGGTIGWANQCFKCGLALAAPPPSWANDTRRTRAVQRLFRYRERKGQLQLFPITTTAKGPP